MILYCAFKKHFQKTVNAEGYKKSAVLIKGGRHVLVRCCKPRLQHYSHRRIQYKELFDNAFRFAALGRAALDSSFQVVSFLSTTGFGQADNATWPFFSNIILLFAAIHCGCSGSTTGGLKSDRMLVSFKATGLEFKKRLHPSSVFRMKIDGITLKDETISAVFLFIVTYISVLLISFIIVLATGVPVAEAFSGTLASLGNAGPGIGSLGTMGNYSAQPDLAKFVYSMDMYLGRIEIFPFLVVLSLIFRRNR